MRTPCRGQGRFLEGLVPIRGAINGRSRKQFVAPYAATKALRVCRGNDRLAVGAKGDVTTVGSANAAGPDAGSATRDCRHNNN